MISYRKLAMRVLGHPLRVPTNTPRPASHRVTALALTAAMVAGMAAPAYAGTYYIGDGNITITKDEDGTHVQQGGTTKIDTDDEITIKGGKRSEDTTGTGSEGGNSGTGSPTTSAAKSASATLKVEDSENEDKDMAYPGDTKGSDSSEGGSEGNETQSTEKDQTGGTTGSKNTGAGSPDPESIGSGDGTSGSESGSSGSGGSDTKADDTPTTGSGTPAEGAESTGSTTGSDDTTGGEKNDPKPGGTPTTGSRTLAKGTESTESNRSAPESLFTYTSAYNDEGTPNESITTLKTAAENFTKNVIRIINNLVSNSGKDNTLNVTLDNVNITAKNDAALSVEGAGDMKITLRGSNTLTNDLLHAGLEHNEKSEDGSYTGKLTITSEKDADGNDTGSLTATGGNGAAGIGSSDGNGAGTIEIIGGDITAIGGNNAAGIGSGDNSNGTTTINIEGGTIVKAQGGSGRGSSGGAGIGSGDIGSGYTGSSTTNITISGGTIKETVGGTTGDGIGGSSGNRSNSTTVTINGGRIEKAQGGQGYSIFDGGDGIHSDDALTIPGTASIGSAIGGSGGSGVGVSGAGNGIYSGGKLTISGGTIGTAQGGSGRSGGYGIRSNQELTIEGGEIKQATGGKATGESGTGGSGIRSKIVKILGGLITKATGGNATGKGGTGGSGIGGSFVNVEGGTINTTGGSGKSGGAGVSTESGIVSIGNSDTPLDLTATAPDADNAIRGRDGKKLDEIIHLEENGKPGLVKLVENGVTRLFHNGVYTKSIYPAGSETHPLGDWVITKKPTCTEPGEKQRSCKVEHCVVTETEELPALGHQWSGWMPVQGDSSREYRICAVCNEVEYRDVSHNSGIGDSTISTGLRVLDPAQADILQNAQLVRLSQISDVLYIDVSHETASLQGVLSDLTGLRSERIGTVVFSTERCTSTLSLSDVAALGAGDTPFTLRHSGSTASFTVGGADHSALLR